MNQTELNPGRDPTEARMIPINPRSSTSNYVKHSTRLSRSHTLYFRATVWPVHVIGTEQNLTQLCARYEVITVLCGFLLFRNDLKSLMDVVPWA